jgi:hypothetical protein
MVYWVVGRPTGEHAGAVRPGPAPIERLGPFESRAAAQIALDAAVERLRRAARRLMTFEVVCDFG